MTYAHNRGISAKGNSSSPTRKAAWHGLIFTHEDMAAMMHLGLITFYGLEGAPQDYSQAVGWYAKAAADGDALGMASLGLMYAEGYGVPRDHVQALSWFRKAAADGDTLGMASLGLMYTGGYGVPRDDVQALSWFRKAADFGDWSFMSTFMPTLISMYANGEGVLLDYLGFEGKPVRITFAFDAQGKISHTACKPR